VLDAVEARDDDDDLREFPFRERKRWHVHQLAAYRGVDGFPASPADVLDGWELGEP
jgi:hypothetical protein